MVSKLTHLGALDYENLGQVAQVEGVSMQVLNSLRASPCTCTSALVAHRVLRDLRDRIARDFACTGASEKYAQQMVLARMREHLPAELCDAIAAEDEENEK